MRTLPAPLLAAQRSSSALPYLKVTISDRIGGIRRLAFSRLYTGSEPDGYHAAAMPSDGSLLRARASGGRVYYQRVANPGAGSNLASWTDLEAAANAGVALCSDGSRVLLSFGAIEGGVHYLDPVLSAMREGRRLYVSAADADFEVIIDVPVEPAAAWQYVVDPIERQRWACPRGMTRTPTRRSPTRRDASGPGRNRTVVTGLGPSWPSASSSTGVPSRTSRRG